MAAPPPPPFDLTLGLENTHVLVTGGCGLIGRVVVSAFLSAGSRVTVVDLHGAAPFSLSEKDRILFFPADITKDIDAVFSQAERKFGPVECVVALASLDLTALTMTDSICDASVEEWKRVMEINVTGTFLTVQRWLRGIREACKDEGKKGKLRNVGCVLVGSEAGIFGVKPCAAYSTGKSAIQVGLLKSVAQDCPKIFPRARINAVAPGPVDTPRLREMFKNFGSQWQYAMTESTFGLPGPVTPEDCARQIIMTCSERYSGGVHGQLLSVDRGKSGNLVWSQEETEKLRGFA